MSDEGNPQALGRVLRQRLRWLRVQAELTQKEVAEALGFSQSKIIRIENGSVRVAVDDASALCALYDADQKMTNEVIALAQVLQLSAKKKPWRSAYADD